MNHDASLRSEVFPDDVTFAPREGRTTRAESFLAIVTLIELIADFLTCFWAVNGAYLIYHMLRIGKQVEYPERDVAAVGVIAGLSVVLLLHKDGAYRGGTSLLRIRETERAIRVPTESLMLLVPIGFLFSIHMSRAVFLLALLLTPFLLILQKQAVFSLVQLFHACGYGTNRVVIYGAGDSGRRVLSSLMQSPKLGLLPVAVIDDNAALSGTPFYELGYYKKRTIRIHNGPLSPEILRSFRCNLLVIAIPSLSFEKYDALLNVAKQAGVGVASVPGPGLHQQRWMDPIDLGDLLLTSTTAAVAPWGYEAAKRTIDLAISICLLLILSPVFLLIALLTRFDSPGPVLFVQQRVGKDGRLFKMYKFRSMHMAAQKYEVSPVAASDPRITTIGRFIRRTSADELPQLFNVILGNMSLVGPRPEMPFIVESYTAFQRQRLQVVPGITGLWQLSADRGAHIHQNIWYDLYYIRHRSTFLDAAILLHTLMFAMRGV